MAETSNDPKRRGATATAVRPAQKAPAAPAAPPVRPFPAGTDEGRPATRHEIDGAERLEMAMHKWIAAANRQNLPAPRLIFAVDGANNLERFTYPATGLIWAAAQAAATTDLALAVFAGERARIGHDERLLTENPDSDLELRELGNVPLTRTAEIAVAHAMTGATKGDPLVLVIVSDLRESPEAHDKVRDHAMRLIKATDAIVLWALPPGPSVRTGQAIQTVTLDPRYGPDGGLLEHVTLAVTAAAQAAGAQPTRLG